MRKQQPTAFSIARFILLFMAVAGCIILVAWIMIDAGRHSTEPTTVTHITYEQRG